MTGVVVPFPLTRRRPLVEKAAQRAAVLSQSASEKHIEQTLRIQREALERKAVDPEIVSREMVALERAIRATLWDVVLRSPGGAA